MNNPWRLAACVLTSFIFCASAAANQRCDRFGRGYVGLFFNGVQNSLVQANEGLREVSLIRGLTASDGLPIEYQLAYNETDGFFDFLELYQQRSRELVPDIENNLGFFWGILRDGGTGPEWAALIANSVIGAEELLNGLRNDLSSFFPSRLSGSPAAADESRHRALINSSLITNRAIVMVAHSQGNLFANRAYDYASSLAPESQFALVHIAPASFKTNGRHILGDLDLVIQGLGAITPVPPTTDLMPGIAFRSPGANGKTDYLGHGLIEIYLNRSLAVGLSTIDAITQAFTTVQPPDAIDPDTPLPPNCDSTDFTTIIAVPRPRASGGELSGAP